MYLFKTFQTAPFSFPLRTHEIRETRFIHALLVTAAIR